MRRPASSSQVDRAFPASGRPGRGRGRDLPWIGPQETRRAPACSGARSPACSGARSPACNRAARSVVGVAPTSGGRALSDTFPTDTDGGGPPGRKLDHPTFARRAPNRVAQLDVA